MQSTEEDKQSHLSFASTPSSNSSVSDESGDVEVTSPPPKTMTKFHNGRYINPYRPEGVPYLDFIKWNLSRKSVKPLTEHEKKVDHPVLKVDLGHLATPVQDSSLRMTWIGHSTFYVQFAGVNFLTDPVWAERASPVSFAGPKRLRPVPCSLDDLPQLDFIILSHDHFDHLCIDTAKKIGNRAKWYIPVGRKPWFNAIGITNLEELEWWQEADFNGRIKVVCVPCSHHSQRSPIDRNVSLWCSWIVVDKTTQKKYYHSGDTAYCSAFKEIGHHYGPIDLSCIAIGAYEPRFFIKNFHINPEESVMVHKDIKSIRSVGMHWGTFILTDEPIMEPPKLLREEATKANLTEDEFTVMKIGETKTYNL
ncbi:hypothetical protein SAMD00019534_081450 [Acytostelium subglobosum LB1]|uniref:hypothetical protein n=1 Tax=Acytostelium subglobosum LB1 TaxID=1410327 RepID=UPI000644C23C|nr:hypothetical protein SAMD00019534_081450 [Acytostelium subglobosum LB1]GAM24970.1 hypothetical protein SAMD00019534_081450 [Acytostelium subglobosum LB1]|eukprot:XP_012752059.1 hypothetical protein SAMD00019534_081450 [Acytostelium subglobosum LB1]